MDKKTAEHLINRAITTFVADLDSIRQRTEDALGVANDKVSELDNMKLELKSEREKLLIDNKAQKDKLTSEIMKFRDLQDEINKDRANVKQLENDVTSMLRDIELRKQQTEDIMKMKDNEMRKQIELRKDYELKVSSLKTDFEELDKKQREIAERDRMSKIRENNSLKEEQKIINREKVLAENELDVQLKIKELSLEHKKMRLKQLTEKDEKTT